MPLRTPNHISHVPAGQPCANERDNGKCLLEGCKGVHGIKDWTGVECTNPCYRKYKVCPDFLPTAKNKGKICKDKHSQRPNGMKAIADAKKLAQQEFEGMWAVMEI